MNQSAFRAEMVEKGKGTKRSKPKFRFGKYNGRTLEWVSKNDPQYVVWVHDNVARSYWPVGFLEVYKESMLRIEDVIEEDELDDWARSEIDG